MKRLFTQFFFGIIALFLFVSNAAAHCEIPCGIYDDEMRITLVLEHITTIEKSMNIITEIEKSKQHNANQLIRWVTNKEIHANEIQEIVSQYFMTQRIKAGAKDYEKKLAILHQMLVVSMKCKQTTDISNITKLRTLVNEFQTLYFTE
jgi:nickel superoxide dismutase